MAEKKSFVMYADWENFLDVLTDEEKGRLLTAVFAYFNRGESPEFGGALKMAFVVISQQLDRDREKWEKVCERNRKNGAKGGRPSTKPTGFSGNPTKPKKPDNDTDTEHDNDTEYDTDIDTENDNEYVIDNVSENGCENVTGEETETAPCGASSCAPAPAHKKIKKINNSFSLAEEKSRPSTDGLDASDMSYEQLVSLEKYKESVARMLREGR